MLKVKQTITGCCSKLIEAYEDGYFSLSFKWGVPHLYIRGMEITSNVYNVKAITHCPFCGEKL